MKKLLKKDIVKKTLAALIIVELLSFLAFMNPELNGILFFVFIISAFVFSFYNLRYGVVIVLSELFISSKGYLFFLDIGDKKLSIRIALWLVIILVWFTKELWHLLKTKKLDLEPYKKPSVYYLVIVFFFVLFAIINGYLAGNSNSFLFNDVNAWFYFLLIFPMLKVFNDSQKKVELLNVFLTSAIWTSMKTFILFYFFTHNFTFLPFVYKWVRDTGVGELTRMSGGLYRIFFQTHIFIIIAFFIVFNLLLYFYKTRKENIAAYYAYLSLSVLFFSVSILNFSRSNWVGLFFGLVVMAVLLLWSRGRVLVKTFLVNFIKVLVFSILFIFIIVEIPFPKGVGDATTMGEALKERSKQISGEAGVSSRWALLPKLKEKLAESPFVGHGFGEAVTYNSSDPRIRNEDNPEGVYTTFAYEWGWLDIWIKLGFLGFVSYIVFIVQLLTPNFQFRSIKKIFTDDSFIKQSFFISLIVVSVIHFFSPYFNHPLGIGFLLMSVLYLDD